MAGGTRRPSCHRTHIVTEVPSDKLENFALTRDRGDAPSGLLVRLRVLAPGWKRGGEVVVPPRAELVG